MAKHPLTSTEISVGVNEPAVGKVIVPALEVVEAAFCGRNSNHGSEAG